MIGNELSFGLAREQVFENCFAALWVGGEGDLVHIAQSTECFDVGMVWVRRQGISEKDHATDVFGGDERSDGLIAAKGA